LKRRRQAERRKNARKSWRARQKEALAHFSARRREEESRWIVELLFLVNGEF
jgi:hypothetical protein